MDTEKIDWKAQVDKVKEDLLRDLDSLIAIDSVRDDSSADSPQLPRF